MGKASLLLHATTMSTIAAVLRDEPKPAGTLTAALPHDLEKVVNRCLRNDPARRFQHMADLKVALEELKEESESGQLMTAAPIMAAAQPRAAWVVAVTKQVYSKAETPPGPLILTRSTLEKSVPLCQLAFNSSNLRSGMVLVERVAELKVDVIPVYAASTAALHLGIIRILRDSVLELRAASHVGGRAIAGAVALGGDELKHVEEEVAGTQIPLRSVGLPSFLDVFGHQ